ncbi:uncharacterized protein [Miscanthus floridulus]|uniref:uncharacterized protein isoform X1 n=1 Tax=Miscanthus floridulus TaxID=154761 RepID=UPI003459D0A6
MVHQAQGQLVQELATGGLPAPPSRYVLREEDRPTGGGAAPELEFPTVDVRRLAEPGDTDEVAKLRAALQSWGLFARVWFGGVASFGNSTSDMDSLVLGSDDDLEPFG